MFCGTKIFEIREEKIISKLPQIVCSFDIETKNLDSKQKAKSQIAIAGAKIYTLKGSRYYPNKHIIFTELSHSHLRKAYKIHPLKDLEAFLRSFPGIIIGHNLFRFDYRVLFENKISLSGVIEKSVDPFFILYRKKNNNYQGLSLDQLAKLNLIGENGKTFLGSKIPELWRKGFFTEIFEYNENDCRLAFGLWITMVNNQGIQLKNYADYMKYERKFLRTPLYGYGYLFFSRREYSYLIGNRKTFSIKKWKKYHTFLSNEEIKNFEKKIKQKNIDFIENRDRLDEHLDSRNPQQFVLTMADAAGRIAKENKFIGTKIDVFNSINNSWRWYNSIINEAPYLLKDSENNPLFVTAFEEAKAAKNDILNGIYSSKVQDFINDTISLWADISQRMYSTRNNQHLITKLYQPFSTYNLFALNASLAHS